MPDKLETIYYSKGIVELLHKEFDDLSPEFWHHVMNPYCPDCLAERGKAFIEGNDD